MIFTVIEALGDYEKPLFFSDLIETIPAAHQGCRDDWQESFKPGSTSDIIW